MEPNLYSIDATKADADALLAHWRWLVPRSMHPIELTLFGDWFLTDEAGAIWFLDTARGDVHPIAATGDEFASLRTSERALTDWYKAPLADACRSRGLSPGQGECLSYVIPPPLGGDLTLENIEVSSHALHQGLLAQAHFRNREHPDGTPIRTFVDKRKGDG